MNLLCGSLPIFRGHLLVSFSGTKAKRGPQPSHSKKMVPFLKIYLAQLVIVIVVIYCLWNGGILVKKDVLQSFFTEFFFAAYVGFCVQF